MSALLRLFSESDVSSANATGLVQAPGHGDKAALVRTSEEELPVVPQCGPPSPPRLHFSQDASPTRHTIAADETAPISPVSASSVQVLVEKEKTKKWDKEVLDKFKMVMKALSREICSSDKLSKHLRFQIFGADLAPDEDLNGTIIEINKGPDIGFKDDRDGSVKKKMVEDAFNVIEPLDDSTKNEFIQVF